MSSVIKEKRASARIEEQPARAGRCDGKSGFTGESFCDSLVKLGKQDYLDAILLASFAFLLHVWGLGHLEFFRHTEADRTLIAWEMVETREYVVPHLIHSVILTKPPLYYWILAGAIKLFANAYEYTVRFPSVLIASFYAFSHFLFLRKAHAARTFALLSTAMLVTGAAFFILATLAEIDMCFGFLCALAFDFAYLALEQRSLPKTIIAYSVAAAAFLAKGPPIVFFYAAGVVAFYVYKRRQTGKTLTTYEFIFWNALGSLVFAVLVMSWLLLVSQAVGWEPLAHQVRVEVFDRVLSETHHPRGPLFYIGTLFSGLAPWSVFLAVGLLVSIFQKSLPIPSREHNAPGPQAARDFFFFNAIFVVSALLMLSLAEGKSSRYFFPVYGCAINLTAFYVFSFQNSQAESWFYRLGKLLGGLGILAFPVLLAGVATGRIQLEAVSASSLIFGAFALALPLGMLFYASTKKQARAALVSIVMVMCGLRIAQDEVFIPFRNETRSVKPMAIEINSLLPEGITLYNIEFFERWVTYYLKHLGRNTERLDPERAKAPSQVNGKSYLLLNASEESWRLEQMKDFDPEVRVIKEFHQANNRYLLVEATAQTLPKLEPHEYFPTVPSPAFYMDKARQREKAAAREVSE